MCTQWYAYLFLDGGELDAAPTGGVAAQEVCGDRTGHVRFRRKRAASHAAAALSCVHEYTSYIYVF